MSADPEQPIHAALARGDIAAAAAWADQLRVDGRESPLILNLCAWKFEQQGDHATAEHLLWRALDLGPGDPLILGALAGAARRRGALHDAVRLTDQALARDRRCAPAWLERGYALDAGGSIRASRDSFGEAARLDPSLASAWGGLSHAAARLGDRTTALAAAEHAFAIDPLEPLAVFGYARGAIDDGAFAAAAQRLVSLLESNPTLDNRLLAQSLLGDARSRAGDIESAFAAYTQANAAFLALRGSGPTESQTDFVRRIASGVEAASPESWPREDPDPLPGQARRHIFVVGFPRSGTTLMENILASLPGAHALEERATLEAADLAFLVPEGGIEAFGRVPESELVPYRAAYWETVFAAGVPRDADIFIDMDPMKSLRLPLIARLFPDAHVVFMRRDPRDVVWSCFRTAFAPSSAAFEFTSLERAAALYDAAMALVARCRAVLPLNLHEVRYERLVGDFEAETRRLCEALGLQWTDALLRFDRTAERRGVGTASVGQVRRGLYNGSGQWRAFARYLEAVLPVLEPWI